MSLIKYFYSVVRSCNKIQNRLYSNQSYKHWKSVVAPCIDLHHVLEDKSNFQNSLTLRNLDVDLEEITRLWTLYRSLLDDKSKIDEERELNKLSVQAASHSKEELDGLKNLGKNLRQDFKNVSNRITSLESELVPKVLCLPNFLSNDVNESEYIVKQCGESLDNDWDHLTTGKQLNLIDYIDPYCYFLKGLAARYEWEICQCLIKDFCTDGYVALSNPDFSRRSLVDGLYTDDIHKRVLTLGETSRDEHNGLYLNGGTHDLMFCALFVNSIVELDSLPIKLVSHGRTYSPPTNNLTGLHNVVQNTSVNFFLAATKASLSERIDKIIDKMWDFYLTLNIPVRLVRQPATQLLNHESLRMSFQIFSPKNNCYVEVGNVSKIDDFVSRRLRMYYRDGDNDHFLHLLTGQVLKLPVLLACVLENHPDQALLMLKQHLDLFK